MTHQEVIERLQARLVDGEMAKYRAVETGNPSAVRYYAGYCEALHKALELIRDAQSEGDDDGKK